MYGIIISLYKGNIPPNNKVATHKSTPSPRKWNRSREHAPCRPRQRFIHRVFRGCLSATRLYRGETGRVSGCMIFVYTWWYLSLRVVDALHGRLDKIKYSRSRYVEFRTCNSALWLRRAFGVDCHCFL